MVIYVNLFSVTELKTRRRIYLILPDTCVVIFSVASDALCLVFRLALALAVVALVSKFQND